MGDKTGIQWSNATLNPTVGCSIVSPGCTNCYAMAMAARLEAMGGKGGEKYAGLTERVKGRAVWNGVVRLDERALEQAYRWTRPRKIFVNSMSDLFHEGLSDDDIEIVFSVMEDTPRHTYQILTKRPERMREFMLDRAHRPGWPLPNVWLGVSTEDQPRADERIHVLASTPARVRWISAEPLIGRIVLSDEQLCALDWIVVGGESGPRARDMPVEWAEALLAQAKTAGVWFFQKQMAHKAPIPEHLMVREFPGDLVCGHPAPGTEFLA